MVFYAPVLVSSFCSQRDSSWTRAVHGRLIPLGCTGRSHFSWEQPSDHVMMQIETDANWEVKQEETGSRKAVISFFSIFKALQERWLLLLLLMFP